MRQIRASTTAHPQSVFKPSVFLFALQFHSLITLCYVLPRCENQVIHCIAYFPFLSTLNTFPFLVFHITNYLNCLSYTIPFPLNLKLYYLPVHQTLNDPSAGSPTDTLLRLLLPLDIKVQILSAVLCMKAQSNIHYFHRITQSVGATGGVYKGQGRNQHNLLTCAY